MNKDAFSEGAILMPQADRGKYNFKTNLLGCPYSYFIRSYIINTSLFLYPTMILPRAHALSNKFRVVSSQMNLPATRNMRLCLGDNSFATIFSTNITKWKILLNWSTFNFITIKVLYYQKLTGVRLFTCIIKDITLLQMFHGLSVCSFDTGMKFL